MLKNLAPQAPDKIIQLIGMYAADPRDQKIDLGVGIYKDETGKTPVMRAVKAAEKKLLETQASKSYVGLLGDLGFVGAMRDLVFGEGVLADRIVGAQTPGGTGAIRQLLELVKLANPEATVWISNPTWPNHPAILKYLKIPTKSYRYFDDATRSVDFDGMKADLAGIGPDDVVLLHGCCHNPTGANLTLVQWEEITDLVVTSGATPMIDIAYQGFGDGLDEDAAGVRHMASKVPQMLLAASCSKNFGLYRDRVGAAYSLVADDATLALTKGAMTALNRLNFSFPPDHGAKVVEIILKDPELRADWQAELEEMRLRMLTLREGLAAELKRESNSDRFEFIKEHRGMFSRLGASEDKVVKMRETDGIYMVGDSRFNVAGLPGDKLGKLAKAIVAAGI